MVEPSRGEGRAWLSKDCISHAGLHRHSRLSCSVQVLRSTQPGIVEILLRVQRAHAYRVRPGHLSGGGSMSSARTFCGAFGPEESMREHDSSHASRKYTEPRAPVTQTLLADFCQ